MKKKNIKYFELLASNHTCYYETLTLSFFYLQKHISEFLAQCFISMTSKHFQFHFHLNADNIIDQNEKYIK